MSTKGDPILVQINSRNINIAEARAMLRSAIEMEDKEKKLELEELNKLRLREVKNLINLIPSSDLDINSSEHGGLPLAMAAELSNLGMVKLLLKNGADPNILSPPESETALLIASWHGQIDIVKVLLRAGAYVNPISNRDETALLVALRENHGYSEELIIMAQTSNTL